MPKNREHARLPYMGAILLKEEAQFWIVLTIEGIKVVLSFLLSSAYC